MEAELVSPREYSYDASRSIFPSLFVPGAQSGGDRRGDRGVRRWQRIGTGRQRATSDFAIFALEEDCDASDQGITWTGSAARVEGRVQTNSSLSISGAMNTITGEVGYVCDATVRGARTQIGRGPTKGAALAGC